MTDADHECDDPATCHVCRPLPKPEPEPVRVSRPFPARFPGHCGGCNLGIHEGQMIMLVGFSAVHTGCES